MVLILVPFLLFCAAFKICINAEWSFLLFGYAFEIHFVHLWKLKHLCFPSHTILSMFLQEIFACEAMKTVHAEEMFILVFRAIIHQFVEVANQAIMPLVFFTDQQQVDNRLTLVSTELNGYNFVFIPAKDVDAQVVILFECWNGFDGCWIIQTVSIQLLEKGLIIV